MYQAILTRRYLLRKAIPLLAMLSVAMCTAMVIIVLSVMGGFLEMAKQSGRKLVGDVAVQHDIRGIPHYDALLEGIRALPEVAAASPMIEWYGLLKLPDGAVTPVQVMGIEPESYDAVTGFGETVVWRPLESDELEEVSPFDLRHPESDQFESEAQQRQVLSDLEAAGRRLHAEGGEPGLVAGVEINPFNRRVEFGSYDVRGLWLPRYNVTLSVLPITQEGALLEAESRQLPVLNEFFVGRFDVDSNVVFVPLDLLQEMTKLQPKVEIDRSRPVLNADGTPALDPFGEPIYETRPTPGRATKIVIRAAQGRTPEEVRDRVSLLYREFQREYDLPPMYENTVQTWQEQIQRFLAAVQKETVLVTTLFCIISLVSVILVLTIFWTIVQQKTRDIGILRSVGASRLGITWLFLRYGLLLGVIGSLIGGALAYLIVWNINPIHELVGRVTGVMIWDPSVYYFGEVPSDVNTVHALIIMLGGVIFAVAGALIPAIRAAYVDPVTALRYE